MRNSKKNLQKFYYALYSDSVPEVDENGFYTGETTKGYTTPVLVKANISASRGTSEQDVFGQSVDYTKVISTTKTSLPIDEQSLIWIETVPSLEGTVNSKTADYTVSQIAKSLNVLNIAIKKVIKTV